VTDLDLWDVALVGVAWFVAGLTTYATYFSDTPTSALLIAAFVCISWVKLISSLWRLIDLVKPVFNTWLSSTGEPTLGVNWGAWLQAVEARDG
jgi:hypothetical protein